MERTSAWTNSAREIYTSSSTQSGLLCVTTLLSYPSELGSKSHYRPRVPPHPYSAGAIKPLSLHPQNQGLQHYLDEIMNQVLDRLSALPVVFKAINRLIRMSNCCGTINKHTHLTCFISCVSRTCFPLWLLLISMLSLTLHSGRR